MNYDDMLNIELPQNKRYKEDRENKANIMMKESKCQIEIASEHIVNMLFKKVNIGMIKVNKELEEIPQKYQEAVKEIENAFENQDPIINTNKIENICLCRAIGKKIAERMDNDLNTWNKILNVIEEQYIVYKNWVEHLSLDAIRKNKKEIYKISEYKHPLELVRTWGYFRDRSYWNSFDENNKFNKENSKDSWEYVELSTRNGDEFRLNSELKFKSDLLKRLGLKDWILWIKDLPLIQIKYLTLLEIDSISETKELIDVIIKLESEIGSEKEELISLVIHNAIDLLDKINNNLKRYSSDIWAYTEEEKLLKEEFKRKLYDWNEEYLPNYINKLVDDILKSEDIASKNVLNYMLRHIGVRSERDKIIDVFRTEIVDSIIKNKLDIKDIIQIINKENFSKKTILNSLILLFSSDDIDDEYKEVTFKGAWNDYFKLLNEKIYWDIPLNSDYDDHKFVWLMAGVLSNFDNPENKLKDLLDKIYVSSEGWGHSIEDHYSSISSTANILIVGAMSIEWIYNSKTDKKNDGLKLFDFIWDYTHRWIRSISYHPDEIKELLVQLWARLCLVYRDETKSKIIEALNDIDSLEYMLICSKVFLSNMESFKSDIKKDENIKKLVNNSFDIKLPIIKHLNSIDKSKIEWYTSLKDDIMLYF